MPMSIAPTRYTLAAECPVKWTSMQEKSVSKEYLFPSTSAETPADYVLRTYLEFLWLPEDLVVKSLSDFVSDIQSIMSLRYFVPSLLRISSFTSSPGSTSSVPGHPLHELLRPLLLTPRTAAQKYHSHISQTVDDDGGADDIEAHMMWLSYKNEKVEEDDQTNLNDGDFDAEDKWKQQWLERLERREVQIQILLHLVLLSLPGAPPEATVKTATTELPPHLSPSKKRKRKETGPSMTPPSMSIEDCLESFMDKMSMWQLMSSLDADDAERSKGAHAERKGKHMIVDDRDWMQIFCQDIVEPQFKENLPELSALLRSKLFQSSPFADDSASTFSFSSSPPSSPRQKHKRLKPSASTSAARPPAVPVHEDENVRGPKAATSGSRGLQRTRSRSLSVSLEEERARARSVSIGPGNLRKNLLTREVSMTTAFKGKMKAREREQARAAAAKAKAADEKSRQSANKSVAEAKGKGMGITLVAATPTKPKAQKNRDEQAGASQKVAGSHHSQAASRLPRCNLEDIVEDDADDDVWTLPSSPDVLLLSQSSQGRSESESEGDDGTQGGSLDKTSMMMMMGKGKISVTDTPTKASRSRGW